MNDFFRAFNSSLDAAERTLGVPFVFNGTEYPAISADALTVGDRAAAGGRYQTADLKLLIRFDIFTQSGVKKGSVLIYDQQPVRVIEIDRDGDASRWLICGPAGIDTPSR